MTSRVGPKGQVVIPKEFRDRLGIRPGSSVAFRLRSDDGVLEVHPRWHDPIREGPGSIRALTREPAKGSSATDELIRLRREDEARGQEQFGPVAELVPLAARPRSMAWDAFIEGSDELRADAELAGDLAALLPDTTDDIPVR